MAAASLVWPAYRQPSRNIFHSAILLLSSELRSRNIFPRKTSDTPQINLQNLGGIFQGSWGWGTPGGTRGGRVTVGWLGILSMMEDSTFWPFSLSGVGSSDPQPVERRVDRYSFPSKQRMGASENLFPPGTAWDRTGVGPSPPMISSSKSFLDDPKTCPQNKVPNRHPNRLPG